MLYKTLICLLLPIVGVLSSDDKEIVIGGVAPSDDENNNNNNGVHVDIVPVVEKESTSDIILDLAILNLGIKDGGVGFVDDLGLGNYLNDKLREIIPGLESIQLSVKEFEQGSYEISYTGKAILSNLWVDMNIINTFLEKENSNVKIVYDPNELSTKALFASTTETETAEEETTTTTTTSTTTTTTSEGGLFAPTTAEEEETTTTVVDVVPEASVEKEEESLVVELTIATLHELQIKVMSDWDAIEEYWEDNTEITGANLEIISMSFDNVEVAPTVVSSTTVMKSGSDGLNQDEKNILFIVVLVVSFVLLLAIVSISMYLFNK